MTDQCNSHMYEHLKEGSCNCGCSEHSHNHHHHHHNGDDGGHCAEKFLKLADEAWKEVLKEKIKEKIIAKREEHMEKLAEIIAKANGEKWKSIISSKMKCNEFKDNIKEFFSSCD